MNIQIMSSKTNQEGAYEQVNIVSGQDSNYCPLNTTQKWIQEAKINNGALFCSIKKGGSKGGRLTETSIATIVKEIATKIGFDSKNFSGHSLRAGCATYLLEKKIPLNIVAKHLRHKKLDTTLRYDRNQTARILQGIF